MLLKGSLSVAAAAAMTGASAAGATADGARSSSGALTGLRIDSGRVQGVPAALSSVTVFKGIPYARSTAGALRWRPPQKTGPWDGVYVADTFGDICPQSGMPGATLPPMSENCLNLNVWTAAASPDERRPVFVWIYPGRYSGGYASDPTFDGAGLARKGLVVVTLNYRVGAFGFLATPALSAEDEHGVSGNYGLLDQIAALKWVQRNIAAFGGDPRRVTIAGQSAGASSVYHLIDSPLANGLFHRGISESGILSPRDPETAALATSYRPSMETAQNQGVAWVGKKRATTLAEMRALSADSLITVYGDNDPTVAGPVNGNPPLFRPVLDGYVKPWTYEEALARGHQNDVPVMTGNTRDEAGASPALTTTVAAYQALAARKYGDMAEEFLALYPATTDEEAAVQTNASIADGLRITPHLFANEWTRRAKSPVFTYFWEHVPPGAEGTQGAYHGSEINYVFDNLYATDKDWTDADRSIADTLSDYVVNFATHGDPNGPGLPRWAANDPRRPATMEIGDKFRRTALAEPDKLDFYQRYLLTQAAW
ncbi:carboxylesterase/lipase family protein [Streptomyces canus]|uniref:carboxylesterase/lipase family protein n=1 Tax=Streptomyces canus TaxID=58343 RepID=UPI00368810C2